jgi:two-component system, cell cycle sensor histidine kinase and response regulator CckA
MPAPQMVPAPVVLVVDDEPVLLHMMERILLEAGYQVCGASNALRALELASTLRVPPAVLLSDIRMEPVDGPDLARLMRQASPSTRVLFVSGYPEDPDHAPFPAPLLRKPFTPEQLVRAVAQVLAPARQVVG